MEFSHISAFDLDHTLFSQNSSYRFGIYAGKTGVISSRKLFYLFWGYLCLAIGLISVRRINRMAFHLIFQGLSEEEVNGWVEDFLKKDFDQLLYPPVVEKLRQAQQAGHLTVILSSSPNVIVEAIAKRFGVSLWGATSYSIDQERRFCAPLHIMQGGDKARFIAQLCEQYGLSKQDVTAYSDSSLDLPFLEAAGNPVAVNPDRRLRKICKERQWPII